MQKMSNKLLLTALALAISSAYAADEVIPDTIEKVIVTAQKRTQSTVDVAQSMSVVSGAQLEQVQATGFADYLKLVPGMQLVQGTQGAGRIVLRGINTNGVASTVAVYVDETPFGSSSGLVNGAVLAGDFDTFDMSRIEVLRGPQGALYGASSLGGLLKFVTNEPRMDKFQVRARVGVSSVDGGEKGHKANLMVNAPISDTVAFRASGSFNKTPGYIDSIGTAGSDVQNDINKSKNTSARASLMIKPGSTFSLRLSAIAQNIETDAPSAVESDPTTLETKFGRPTQSQFVPAFRNVDYRVYNATASWDLGAANLTSSTSMARQDQSLRDDATVNLSALIKSVFGATNELYLGQNTNLNKVTQEVRLASNTPGTVDWLVGAFYTNEKGLIHQAYVPVTPGTLTLLTTIPNLALIDLSSKYRELAGFGNATVHFGERYEIDLGARYSKNEQEANQVGSGALVGATNNKASSSESVLTYSVAPKFKLDQNSAVYARVAKGYRPGGPNVLPPNAPASTPATYEADTVVSSELGYKMTTPDGMFGFEAAAFHIKWKNIQLFAVVNNFGVNINGVGATSDGVEFTVTAVPVRGLRLSANGAYSNARLDGTTSPIVGGVAGDKLPFSPKISVGINADYRWPVGNAAAYVGGSVRHLSEQSGAFDNAFRTANGRQRELPAYSVVDLHAGLDMGSWSVDAYVKNVGNSDAKTSTSGITANGGPLYPNGAMMTGLVAPRTIGLSMTKEF
ncbi:TonB-dependent receptor [Massilia sp. TWR1-2-2]|uniref:TonB-dependent receptor n=1 Tax=Massilia sp. TWR1-2-2 TaxID=2804584 RepID=UPI003CF1CABE